MNITDTDKQSIKELVISYGAYNRALNWTVHGRERDEELRIWGRMLLQRQVETGIEVIGPEWVENVLKHLEPPAWEMTI